MHGPLGPEYLGYPEVVPTLTTLCLLGPNYFDDSPGDRATKRRDRSGVKEGGDKYRNTNIKFSVGYQTKGGLDAVAQPPIPNVANFDMDNPIPGGTRMTINSPIKSLPRTITLAGQRLPPILKEPYLLEGFNPRG